MSDTTIVNFAYFSIWLLVAGLVVLAVGWKEGWK